MQKEMGCRFESDQTIPETLTESVNLVVEVSTKNGIAYSETPLTQLGH
jgi:hypothetical protein